jgi:hypothetical protein
MPLLHFRITEANQTIKLSRAITAQTLIFKRAVVYKSKEALANESKPYMGGVAVSLSFLTGSEVISSVSSNELYVPFDEFQELNDVRFELPLESENIRPAFTLNVFNYTGEGQPTFGTTNGEITYIDLFFSFSEIDIYDSY